MLKEFHVSHVQLPTPPRKFKNPMTASMYLMINIWEREQQQQTQIQFHEPQCSRIIVWVTSKAHSDLLKKANTMARTQKKSLKIFNIL